MIKLGPKRGELLAFRDCIMEQEHLSVMQFYERLSKESGKSVDGIRKYYAPPQSQNFRPCPYASWRLWHLTILGNEPE